MAPFARPAAKIVALLSTWRTPNTRSCSRAEGAAKQVCAKHVLLHGGKVRPVHLTNVFFNNLATLVCLRLLMKVAGRNAWPVCCLRKSCARALTTEERGKVLEREVVFQCTAHDPINILKNRQQSSFVCVDAWMSSVECTKSKSKLCSERVFVRQQATRFSHAVCNVPRQYIACEP